MRVPAPGPLAHGHLHGPYLAATVAVALVAALLLLQAGVILVVIAGLVLALGLAYRKPFVAFLIYFGILAVFHPARLLVGQEYIPVYFIDIFLAVSLLGLFLSPEIRRKVSLQAPLDRLVAVLMLSILPGFLILLYRFPSTLAENFYFLFRVLLHIGAFFAASRLVTERSRMLAVLRILYVGIIINGIWAIAQALPIFQSVGIPITDYLYDLVRIPYDHELPGQVIRAAAGLSSPNDLGGFLAMFLPLALFHPFPRSGMTARFLVPLVLFLGGVGLILSFSRTAIAGLAIGLTLSFLALKNLGLMRSKAPFFMIGLALAGWGLTSLISPVGEVMAERASGYADPFEDSNFQARVVGHYRFAGAVAEDPTLLLFGENLRLLDLERRSIVPPDTFKGFVSNSWLLVLLDSGIIAFVAYLLIYYRTVLLVWRRIVSASGLGIDTSLLVGIFVALVALFFTHLIDNYMAVKLPMKGMYFAFLGLAVAELSFQVADTSSRKLDRPSPQSELR